MQLSWFFLLDSFSASFSFNWMLKNIFFPSFSSLVNCLHCTKIFSFIIMAFSLELIFYGWQNLWIFTLYLHSFSEAVEHANRSIAYFMWKFRRKLDKFLFEKRTQQKNKSEGCKQSTRRHINKKKWNDFFRSWLFRFFSSFSRKRKRM